MIRVQAEDFNLGDEYQALCASSAALAPGGAGAVAMFVGLVRDMAPGLDTMTLEHYPGMTEKSLAVIAAEAEARWPLIDYCIVHRIGELKACDQIVFVGVTSAHRAAAFAAAEFIMDFLKTRAPFWKKESLSNGQAQWVAAKDSDEQCVARWQDPEP
jgi:molybdopterin synthase catalytic subunit